MRRSLSTAVLFVGFALTACNAADTSSAETAVKNAGCTVNGTDPRACLLAAAIATFLFYFLHNRI